MITCKFSGDTVSHFDSFTHLFESNAVVYKYRQYEYASSLCLSLVVCFVSSLCCFVVCLPRSEKSMWQILMFFYS